MSDRESILKEWQKLISWFEKVKIKTGVEISDNFTINQDKVSINGETLHYFIEGYTKHNDIPTEQTKNLNWVDVRSSSCRVKLQGYLLNQLYSMQESL